MHFSTSSQRSKICFGYHEIIFNGEKVLKFSQIFSVSLTAFSHFFTPSLSGEPVKTWYFMVRLIKRVDPPGPPPPYGQFFVISLLQF